MAKRLDAAPAARYLAHASKKTLIKKVEDMQDELLIIESWFLGLDIERAAGLTMPETTRAIRVFNAANMGSRTRNLSMSAGHTFDETSSPSRWQSERVCCCIIHSSTCLRWGNKMVKVTT